MRRVRWRVAAFGPAFAAGLALAPPSASAQGGFTPEQRQEVVNILRRALSEDPSILREAVNALQASEQRQRETAAQSAIRAQANALFRDPADPVRGNPQGAVTLVEFFDVRCGYCKQMQPAVDELLLRNPDVRLVLKDLPVLGPSSVLASRALLAAQRQGKYVELQDALMRLREDPAEPVLRREAEGVGIDWARLRRDMDDPAIARRLQDNLQLAQTLRIEGTPALVIGVRMVPGAASLATMEGLIAEARTAAR